MKRLLIVALLLIAITSLTSCSVLEARYAASSARSYAQAEGHRSAASIAASQSAATQSLQVTAQIAQVEATNRMMAFLAATAVIGQSNTTLIIAVVLVIGFAVVALKQGRSL